MPTLQEFRKQYPEYNRIPKEELIRLVNSKFANDPSRQIVPEKLFQEASAEMVTIGYFITIGVVMIAAFFAIRGWIRVTDKEKKNFSGFILLMAFGVIMTPFAIMAKIIIIFFNAAEPVNQNIGNLLLYGFLLPVVLVYSIILFVTMAQKRLVFINLYTIGALINFLTCVFMLAEASQKPVLELLYLAFSFSSLVWIPYVYLSRRVKNVFVR